MMSPDQTRATLDSFLPFEIRRVLALVIGFPEMIFFGGIIFGFNALFPVLKSKLIFAYLCENQTSALGCEAQTSMFANAFTTFNILQMVLLIAIGMIIDYVGLRFMKLVSTIIFFIGVILFAFLTPDVSWLLFVAGSFTCVGGMGMLVCNYNVSHFFNKTAVIVLAVMTGSFDAGSSMFAIIRLTYEAGVSYRTTFLVLAFCSLFLGLFSACFILTGKLEDMATRNPSKRVSELENEKAKHEISEEITNTDNISIDNKSPAKEDVDAINVRLHELHPTRKSSILSFQFLLIILYFMFALLRFTFYLSQLTPQANSHFTDTSIVDRVGQILSFVMASGIFSGLLCGAVIDKLRAYMAPKIDHVLTLERSAVTDTSLLWMRLRPMGISMCIMNTFALMVSCLVFVPEESVYYVTFVFVVIMRGFLYSTFSSALLAAFPMEQFGTLYGIGGAIGGAFSCIQYAILLPIPTVGNGIALGATLCSFIPSIAIVILSFSYERKALQVVTH